MKFYFYLFLFLPACQLRRKVCFQYALSLTCFITKTYISDHIHVNKEQQVTRSRHIISFLLIVMTFPPFSQVLCYLQYDVQSVIKQLYVAFVSRGGSYQLPELSGSSSQQTALKNLLFTVVCTEQQTHFNPVAMVTGTFPLYVAAILDSPNVLIAEDEKIICEITKDNETIIEER